MYADKQSIGLMGGSMKRRNIIYGLLCVIVLILGGLYYQSVQEKIDRTAPVIKADAEEITVGIEATQQELCAGITAADDRDGDLTEHVIISNIRKKEDGGKFDFLITYTVFDKANNQGTLTRTLHYQNYEQTRFDISEQLRFPANQSIDILEYVTAEDCIDGDLTSFITIEGNNVNFDEELPKGYYTGTLSVTNSVGDTTRLPIEIEIYEDSFEEQNTRPRITLKKNIVYLKTGEKLNLQEWIDSVWDRGEVDVVSDEEYAKQQSAITEPAKKQIPISRINIDAGAVDTAKPGIYAAAYSYVSEETGQSCQARMIVVVE